MKKSPLITVFTPTYNRAYILPRLYESLSAQTCKDFEWLVIDDGSMDETSSLLALWQKENKIQINFIVRTNGGKSSTINLGVQNAKGDVFFIVDSDDFLTDDAIQKITEALKERKNKRYTFFIAGFCYKKRNYRTNTIIASSSVALPEAASSLELAFKYKQPGDKAEVFDTDLLRRFPFPEISGNKFVPEALVWYRIAALGYKLIIKNDAIYNCDYLEDGYTKNFNLNLKKNPEGFMLFYKECLGYKEIPFITKLKYLCRFLQSSLYVKKKSKALRGGVRRFSIDSIERSVA